MRKPATVPATATSAPGGLQDWQAFGSHTLGSGYVLKHAHLAPPNTTGEVRKVGIWAALAELPESLCTRSGAPFASVLTVQSDQYMCRHLRFELYKLSYTK